MAANLPPVISVTPHDVEAASIQPILEAVSPKIVELYFGRLYEKSKQAEEAGDTNKCAILALLGVISSFGLKLDKPGQPFVPMFVSQNSRSLTLDDLTEDHFEMLGTILPILQDDELKARCADVLWSRRLRKIEHGRIAFGAYLASAQQLDDPSKWSDGMVRLERAFQLARSFGGDSPEFSIVVAHIRARLNELGTTDPLFFTAALMRLIQELPLTEADIDAYIQQAKTVADRALTEGDPNRARAYLEVVERWYHKRHAEEGARDARLSIAETYVSQAKAQSTAISEASLYRQAITEFRRAGHAQERVSAVLRALEDAQRRSLREMRTISQSVDITDQVQWARRAASGKNFDDAIRQLTTMVQVPSKTYLRQFAEEMMTKAPLRAYISGFSIGGDARVVGTRPSAADDDRARVEAFIESEMVGQAAIYHGLVVNGLVEPYRYQLSLELSIRLGDLLKLVRSRPFVPAGREMLFAKGLLAGFDGEYAIAVHLLVPQIENSLRTILWQSGERVFGHDQHGVEDVIDLGGVLENAKLSEILGEDLVFDLKGVLVSRSGPNFRNNLSHGLLDYKASSSIAAAYLWWLTLRLCLQLEWTEPAS